MKSIKQHILVGCSVGIADGSNFRSTSLRWLHVAWYTYQVSWRLVQEFKQYESFASAISEALFLVLLLGTICEVSLWNGLRWHDIYTWLPGDQFRNLRNITVITAKISGARITDRWDLWSKPLRWLHVTWYACHVSWSVVQAFKQY
jgi:hypothetical protein